MNYSAVSTTSKNKALLATGGDKEREREREREKGRELGERLIVANS